MDRAGVPANSELRRIESIFFPVDIREIPDSDPPEKLLSAQAAIPDPIVPGGERSGRGGSATNKGQVIRGQPRTPSRSEMLTRGPRMSNLNPKLEMIILRLMTPQKVQTKTKLRTLGVGFSFVVVSFCFSFPWLLLMPVR